MSDVLADAVASALNAVASALPSLSKTMTADGISAPVVLASSVDAGIAMASSSGADESRRIVAQVADFPDLSVQSLIDLDGDAFLVTSLRNTGNAAWFVGLSASMSDVPIVYGGTRRERNSVRPFEFSFNALVAEGESANAYSDAAGASSSRRWYVVVREHDWPMESRPDTGDRIEFYLDGRRIELRVGSAEPKRGYFTITARDRQ